jgi:hypothetical protein
MSTTPAAMPASVTPHPTWYARAGTWFLKIGQAVKNAVLKIAGDMPSVQAEISKIAPTVEGVSELFLPGSSKFEQHLLDVWGVAASAVKDAGVAAGANAISITLDAGVVNDIKGFLPAVEAYLHPAASASPAPAGGPALQAAPAAQPPASAPAATVEPNVTVG